MLIGAGFVIAMAAIGVWSIWQRRHAWGWWETPTTINVALLTIGALFTLPAFNHRRGCTPQTYGADLYCYWGHSYVVGAVLVFTSFAWFAVGVKRRLSYDRPTRRWILALVKIPTVVGVTVMLVAYGVSGAASDPWLLDPQAGVPNSGVRLFWSAIAVVMAYQLALIAALLLDLRADTRRGDRGPILVYLGTCAAGLALTVVAVATAAGFSANRVIVVESAVLFALMVGGGTGVAGLSWRRKLRRLAPAPRDYSPLPVGPAP